MIKEVIRLIGNSLPATIDVEICVTAKSDGVFINPVEIHQVIMNLCTNAYHAMREKGGHLQMSLSDHHGPLLGWSLHPGPLPQPLLRLTVRDTGTGIPDELLPKIFDPFFTTKKQGEGTGMGLAIVHDVVTRCKGCVSVETTEGRGTAFHVYLPRHSDVLGPAGLEVLHGKTVVESVRTSSLQSRVRVLYVDDEFQVARLAQRFLSRLFNRQLLSVSSKKVRRLRIRKDGSHGLFI